jgi:formamidopyrimidine-DNA glycosylase
MPELPDILTYLHALRPRVVGHALEHIRIVGPFLLRTFEPPIDAAEGKRVTGLRRIGKRIVFEMEDDLFLVFHLMIAGRFDWTPGSSEKRPKIPAKIGLAAFDFPTGTLLLIEAGSHRRASLHLFRGEAALMEHQPRGLEVLESSLEDFARRLRFENHTLKRSLSDPYLFSGIGTAYSDEILHAAQLSPVKLTDRLTDDEIERLHAATTITLRAWTDRLIREIGDGFPKPSRVTAFRADFAVHGKFGQPCPACGTPVQRIIYAENETNYCPRCQTGGKLLADRSLSRLLKSDWPKTVDELEERRKPR